MANKLGKLLLLTAAAGAAAAGAYYYLKKKEDALSAEYYADEDFDDFSDEDPEAASNRNYVPLHFGCDCTDTGCVCEEVDVCACDATEECCCEGTSACACETASAETEEFFDEEDPADQEPSIQD